MMSISVPVSVLRLVLFIAVSVAVAAPVSAASKKTIKFDVYREGSLFGQHQLVITENGRETVIDVAIDFTVDVAFINFFEYKHRNREVWRDGRLYSMTSTTDDNGTPYEVRARRVGSRVKVEGSGGSYWADGGIVPTTYWNPLITRQSTVLDTQRGVLRPVEVVKLGRERIEAMGRRIVATRYRIKGELQLDVWYDDAGEFVKMSFTARGSEIEYKRRAA